MRNFTVTSVWGIPIRINVSLFVFLPVLAWLIGSGEQIGAYVALVDGLSPTAVDGAVLLRGSTPWLIGISAAIGLFVSVTIHELGHSWTAMKYGFEVESITLWILGGLASLPVMPKQWKQEFWIALAGPITSVLVAAVCFALLQFVPATAPVVVFVLGWLVITNVVLAIFNMLPAFPMDGGRVLRALLARRRSYLSATRTAARVGMGFALLFAVVGAVSFSPMLFLLALFVYGAANGESRAVALDSLLDGITVGDVATRDAHGIDASATLGEFSNRMFNDRRTVYPVSENGTIVGIVSLAGLRERPEISETTAVRSVSSAEPLRLDATASAYEALTKLSQSNADGALVEDRGRVVGVISHDDFAQVLELRKQGLGGEESSRLA